MDGDLTAESTTEELLRLVTEGDANAINELIQLHREYLRRVVEFEMDWRLRQRVDPSDVVQETQLEVTQRIQDYVRRRPMSFRVWLRMTACQRLSMLRRFHLDADRRSVAREVALPDSSGLGLVGGLLDGRPSQQLENQEREAKVRAALAQLNETDYEILIMRFFEELTNHEAAEALGIDPTAACKRYGRALIHLREKLVAQGLTSEP